MVPLSDCQASIFVRFKLLRHACVRMRWALPAALSFLVSGVVWAQASVPTAITSSPSGASVTVSGTGCAPGSYTTPASLTWNSGTSCRVSFTDPQVIGAAEYVFHVARVNGALSASNPLTVGAEGGSVLISAILAAVPSGAGPGTATHLAITTPASAAAGSPFQFYVTALDSNNRIAVGYSDPVHITSSDTSAAWSGDGFLTTGVGVFSASLLAAGTQTITASDLLSPSITGTSGGIAISQSTAGLRFVPVTPCRIVDTRDSTMASGFGPPAISGGATGIRSFVVPNSSCGIPGTAAAYSLNVGVVPHGLLGYLTLWPTDQIQPVVSTLNSIDGRIKSNAAIIQAGTQGAINVFATNDTDLILDINGYFVPKTSPTALAFYPMAPCRLVDSREGLLTSGPIEAGTSRTLPILSSSCNVPATAQAYSLNFTVVASSQVGYITAYPTGASQPLAATVNATPPSAPVVVANGAILQAGAGGSVDVYASNTTDLVVDINGYFAPAGTGGLSFYSLTPCRVQDTREPSGSPPFSATIAVDVIGAACGGTNAAEAYVFNATVVPYGQLGYLTLWPQGHAQPIVSTLNALDGAVTSNMAISPTNTSGINAFATSTTHLVLDLLGYFAP